MLFILLSSLLGCNRSNKAEQSDVSTCDATFSFAFPNSGTVDIDFCARHDLEAQFEFDPDDPPEIRQPVMTFYSTLDEGFECTLTISEPSACGVGYYLMDGSSGVTTTTTLDCENVPDEYEGNFSSNGGYLQLTNVDTGTQTGNFTGTPLRTTIEGYLNVTTIEGIGITGSFSLSEDIIGTDAEEVECITNDGDIDNDGDIATVFGGTDCNDNDPNIEGLDSDNDGVSICDDDCDDNDPTTYPSATEICDYKDNDCDNQIDETALGTFFLDSDNDGYGDPTVSTEDCSAPGNYVENNLDCDDNNPQLNQDDDDNDGSSTCDGDCNDNDSALNLLDEDGDNVSTCDGDCDDEDTSISPIAPEIYYDGIDQDCAGDDDFDADGDGYTSDLYGGDDCHDYNSSVYPYAGDTQGDFTDGDCDGRDCAGVLVGNNYFAVCLTGVDWYTANQDCIDTGYDGLATIENATEDNAIYNLRWAPMSIWIGLNDQLVEGNWAWTSGMTYSYTNWGPNEPNNWNDNEDCVILSNLWFGWKDYDCLNTSTGRASVCEKRNLPN